MKTAPRLSRRPRFTSVEQTRRNLLTEERARRDGFTCLAELHAALDHHYPESGATVPVDIVNFEI